MKKYLIPKLIGLSLLSMIILVLISFLEVAIYSHLISPGKDLIQYEKHAEISAPYISGIFGFILFFSISAYWTKRKFEGAGRLALYFPLTYVILDFTLISLAPGVVWADFIGIFLLANLAKFLGCFLGHWLLRKNISLP